jgi:hypothetical protein
MPSQIPQGSLLMMSAHTEEADDSDHMSIDSDADLDSAPLSSSFNRPPWSWPVWQKQTGEDHSPFSPDFKDDSVWDLAEDSQAIWTYINNFWALPDSDQINYTQRSCSDNDKNGRVPWLDWVNKYWGDWKVNNTIEKTLTECGLDPYSVMKQLKVAKVSTLLSFFIPLFKPHQLPDLNSSQVNLTYPNLAEALFGQDAFTADPVCLKEPIRHFIDSLMITHWARVRKWIIGKRKRIRLLKEKVESSWKGL